MMTIPAHWLTMIHFVPILFPDPHPDRTVKCMKYWRCGSLHVVSRPPCFSQRVCDLGGRGVHGAGPLPELYPRHACVCVWKISTQESPHPLRRNRDSGRLSGPSPQSICKLLAPFSMFVSLMRSFSKYAPLWQEYIQKLMPPLIAKWNELKDEDKDLFPLLEVRRGLFSVCLFNFGNDTCPSTFLDMMIHPAHWYKNDTFCSLICSDPDPRAFMLLWLNSSDCFPALLSAAFCLSLPVSVFGGHCSSERLPALLRARLPALRHARPEDTRPGDGEITPPSHGIGCGSQREGVWTLPRCVWTDVQSASRPVRGPWQRLHDRCLGSPERSGRGFGRPRGAAGRPFQHHDPAFPVHAGRTGISLWPLVVQAVLRFTPSCAACVSGHHARGEAELLRVAGRSDQSVLPPR